MKNITKACSYIAGVDSPGMKALQADFSELTENQIEERDSLNTNNGLPYYFKLKIRTTASGKYFENEQEPRDYQRKAK